MDPKLLHFKECFDYGISMGDIDGAVERNGHILWMEWKRGVIFQAFEKQYKAQIMLAKAFTANSEKHTFVFVVGCPVEMTVTAFCYVTKGELRQWRKGVTIDDLKDHFRRWFHFADTGEKFKLVGDDGSEVGEEVS